MGATNLWRKSLDETLAFGWDAFFALRTTFRDGGSFIQGSCLNSLSNPLASSGMNPKNADDSLVLLNLDRLRSCVVVISSLLRYVGFPPVIVLFTCPLARPPNGLYKCLLAT